MNRILMLGIASATLALAPAASRAETQNCIKITSLPTVITTQGVYCLKQDLNTAVTSGNAIIIATNNVTLDCNGFKLGGLAAGLATTTLGIAAQQRSNLTIRNCNVRGFYVGIALVRDPDAPALPLGNVLEDNRLDGNTSIGIFVESDASTIRRNIVAGTGGTPGAGNPAAIFARGAVDVSDNLVDDVTPADPSAKQAIGIFTTAAVGGVIERNRIRNLRSDVAAFGIIASTASEGLAIRDNVIANTTLDPANGIQCVSNRSVAASNLFLGYTVPFPGCADGGGNVSN